MSATNPLSTKAAFNEAINLINSGQVNDALDLCRAAVERDTTDVTMTALLGATLLKAGQFEEAEKTLRRAIDMAPSFAKPCEDLGFLLVEQRRPEEAIEVLRNATRLDPHAEKAHFDLGRALAMCGKGEEADRAFEASFALNPSRKMLALAAEHHKAGRFDEAEALYRELLRKEPRNVDATRLLGGVLANKGEIQEAEVLFRRACSVAPDFTLAWMDLGRLLLEQQRLMEAVECFSLVVEREPGRAKPHYMLAAALAPLGRTSDALEQYQRAIDLRPAHAGARLGLGHTLKTVGREEEAIEAYRECMRIRPDNGESYWSLANLKTYKLTDEEVRSMEAAVASPADLTDQSYVNFLFALAKAYEDRGNYDTAWDYYERGNAKQRETEHYDPVQTEVTNDEIIEVFSKDFLEQNAAKGCKDPSPIFVLGLPRSGSTLIEQILASHSMVEGTSALHYIGRVATSLNRNRADGINYPHAVRELRAEHLQALGQEYLRLAGPHRTEGKPFFVDKMPNNFPSIGFIRLILPNAKIIDARRYPLDSTLSCYRQLFARGQTFVYDLDDIGEYFVQYQRLMDYWHEAMPGKVLTVQYEDLVMDLEGGVRRLLEHCGLPWEEACLQFYETDRPVRTASSEQVRQPVYTSSIHRWRRYEKHLDNLREVLEPVLPRYSQYEHINR